MRMVSIARALTVASVAIASVAAAPDPAVDAGAAADRARRALADQSADVAVSAAEAAVAGAPRDARYRLLLGQAYLASGRLDSAGTAFADTLLLDPTNGKAGLNLALVQIARGQSGEALSTLAANEAIPAVDRGLARALAGDVAGAVVVLEQQVREKGASPKARQNLALAYAMQGQWLPARAMARRDLAPAEADARLLEWMQFVRPARPSDQVAALLGFTPVEDAGQPQRLALDTGTVVKAVEVAQSEATLPPPPPYAAVPEASVPQFEVARPVVQPRPAAEVVTVALRPVAVSVARLKPMPVTTGGRFVVQLGAFATDGVAQAAWSRQAGRYGLTGYQPTQGAVTVRGTAYVRLSVGPFAARGDAVQLCARVQKLRGTCFVRTVAGDAPARWARRAGPERLAAR